MSLSPSGSPPASPAYGETELRALADDINKSKDAAVIFAICRDVHSETLNGQAHLVIVASQDEQERVRAIDLTDLSKSADIKANLESQGIALGATPLSVKVHAQSTLPPSIQLTAHDDLGREHLLIADSWQEYSLSSGSALYYFYIPDSSGDYRWLVGRTVKVTDVQAKKSKEKMCR